MKLKTKFLALLLCTAMLLSLLPASTLHASAYSRVYQVDSGSIYFDKELGAITDWDLTATSIEIPAEIDGVAVTTIGEKAFSYCSNLTSVTIPDSVTSIGEYAFEECSSLTTLVIPDGVTSIGYGAFYNCRSLKNVMIPDSVTSIDGAVLSGTSYYKDKSNWENGVLYNGKHLIAADSTVPGDYTIMNGTLTIAPGAFFSTDSLTSVTIADSVKSIGDSAFYSCQNLTSVTIGDSVISIGIKAFSYCKSLTDIKIGKSVTSIGIKAFSECDSLTSITIPDNVTSIGFEAFYSCDSLANVTIGKSVTNIDSEAFSWCGSLWSVTIPDSVTSIGGEAFYYCDSLASITIGDGVTSIGEDAFYGTAYQGNNDNWENDVLYIGKYLIKARYFTGDYEIKNGTLTIADSAFRDCTIENVTIPDTVTSIGTFAFSRCDSLTSVTIPDSVTSIGTCVFSGCDSLTSVTIPNSVTSIGDSAFKECGLTSVTIPNSVTSIGNYAFSMCDSLTSVTILNGVTSIGEEAFDSCSSLTNVTIPDSVTSIGKSAFWNTAYYNDDSNWENDVLYIDKHLIKVRDSVSGEFTIKNNTITIADAAFDGCDDLTSVTIPDSVITIGNFAFSGCDSMTNVTIGNSVTSIGNEAFDNCESLTSVLIPESVMSIGDDAFHGCKNLTSVTIPDSVTSIGAWAFSGCGELTDVYFGGTEAQWKAISFGYGNSYLLNATIHFNSEPGEEPTTPSETPSEPGEQPTTPSAEPDEPTEAPDEPSNPSEPSEPEIPTENPFTDVKASDYFATPVLWAVGKNITNGMSATSFAPNANCTRGQIVTFLWRACGSPEPTSTKNNFKDVKAGEYYYKAVLWAVENGITTGLSATSFGPNATCTRGQVATFLWRSQGEPAPTSTNNPFSDVKTSDYYFKAVLWAVENDVTQGMGGGKFAPNASCTRGQIVTFLYRAIA